MNPLVDSFGRHITYARLSVTDRCDLRCRYCMAEHMQFLPRSDLLTLEEIEAVAEVLISRGVRRLRLSGGEPLVRRNILDLVHRLGTRIGRGLDELTMTTNGTRLLDAARSLFAGGIRRINVSLDSLRPERFAEITRRGRLDQVLDGIAAAKREGLGVKINMVALSGVNDDEIEPMMRWCAAAGYGLTLIETMPMGEVADDRQQHYLSLDKVRKELEQRFTLVPSLVGTGGPARYFDVPQLGLKLGMITPLSNNFCAGCNRIRIAATGTVYGCLGHEQKVETRDLLRSGGPSALHQALDELLAGKPRRHNFDLAAGPAVERHMSATGG